MYSGVRLKIVCLFIYLYIFVFFFERFSKNVCIIKLRVLYASYLLKNLEDNSSHFANHDVIG